MQGKIKIWIYLFISLCYFVILPKIVQVGAGTGCICNKWDYYSETCTQGGYTGWCSWAVCTDPGNGCTSGSCGPGFYPCNRDNGSCCPIGATPTDPPNPPGGGGCTAGPWTDVGCNWSPCDPGYMLQTRTTSPAGCVTDWKCTLIAGCSTGGGSCDITIPSDPIDLYPDETKDIVPIVNQNPGTVAAFVSQISFYEDNASDFGVCDSASASCTIGTQTYFDTTSAFTSKITASNNVGATANYAVDGIMNTGTLCINDYATVRIINNPAWCQAKEGDIVAVGSISCTIPTSCTAPSCDPTLITSTTPDAPGVAVAGGTVSDGSGQSAPPVSPNLTVEGAAFAGTPFDYAYFDKKASIVSFNPISTSINQSNLLSGSTYAGFHWKKAPAASTISGNIDLTTNRVILFVNGNLTINGPIHVTDGQGFFMVVVNGNITVSSAVGGPQESPTPLPDLEGLYFANGTFDSGTAGPSLDTQLHVRGSVAAGSFTLQRDLSNNSETPGELFEYAPDQVLRLPSFLSRKQVIWREVAP